MRKLFVVISLLFLLIVQAGQTDTLSRLYDFEPGTPIVSSEIDAEFDQIIDALAGTSSKFIWLKNNDSTEPVCRMDQSGTGPIAEFRKSGTTKVAISNTGQIVSSLTGILPPFVVSSTSKVANLNCDLLDGLDSTELGGGGGGGGGGYNEVIDESTPLTHRTKLQFLGASITCVDNAGAATTECTFVPGAGSGTGYDQIQEEGSNLTKRSNLNFIGSAVTCVDNAGRTDCTFTGGADGVGYDQIKEEGTNLTKRANVNFIGSAVTCVDNAGASTTDCSITGGAADGVGYDEVLDEASSLTKRAKVNFTGSGVTCVDNAGSTRTDCTITSGGGLTGWNDTGTEVVLDTSTDEVEIGSAATLAAKLAINGDTDETQLLVQGNATQTSDVLIAEKSDGTDLFRVSNTGTLIGGTTAATILKVLSGTAILDFADPGQNDCTVAQTVGVTGAAVGDPCFVGISSTPTKVWYTCHVGVADTCSIRACKVSNTAENPASQTYRCVVMAF